MKMYKLVVVMTLVITIFTAILQGETSANDKRHSFAFGGNQNREFLLDGEPIQIRCGEIPFQRVPKEYWTHRVQMAKAMGLNAIGFYVYWNGLEQTKGTFDFSGRNDIAGFLKTCADNDMWVMFRPGPYVCGEWDLGGLPYYLLKDPNAKLRTMADENFMSSQERYLKEVSKVAKPFLAKNGGPILMTQLENEFGSFPRKHETKYMKWLKDFWTAEGFGPFYTADGAGDEYLRGVVLPDVAVGLDPGTNEGAFQAGYRNNPGVPVFSSETYTGWIRHWGEGNWGPSNLSGAIEWFMKTKRSFSLFNFHGGTNFGFFAGANGNHQAGGEDSYLPSLTSYDWGAPCNEQGKPTKEYFDYRKMISKYLPELKLPEVPTEIPAIEIKDFTPTYQAPIRKLGNGCMNQHFSQPQNFEMFDQNQGMAIYRTQLPEGGSGNLVVEYFHDYGHVFVDGKHIRTVDRRQDFTPARKIIAIPPRSKVTTLEIWVEAMGRINFSMAMEKERKGLYGKVMFNGIELNNWTIELMPLDSSTVTIIDKYPADGMLGGIFKGIFELEEIGDTFIDMSKYAKGTVYINGINLGRYWNIGPQLRLFCPAPFLKKGENQIVIVDLVQSEARPIRGCKERNYDMNNAKTRNTNNVW